jgi:diacylglycerol kinase family enzyme
VSAVRNSHAALIVNRRSGQGLHQPAVIRMAQARGMAVHLLAPGQHAAAAAGRAVHEGAAVLAVAGGDGTVSAVAQVAVDNDTPLIVVPCGTRNHFASDCGADTANPATMLTALDHGHERRVDVGSVNGRMFLNNVSLGFYANMVRDPQYRAHRLRVTRRYLRQAVLGGGRTGTLSTDIPGWVVLPNRVLTVLVANNAYSPGTAPGPALRPRLDGGLLWIYVLGVPAGIGPVGSRVVRSILRLLTGQAQIAAWATRGQTMTIPVAGIPTAIDGEGEHLAGSLTFASHPVALRLLHPAQPASQTHQLHLQW